LPWSLISFFTSWAGRSGVAVRHAPLGVASDPRVCPTTTRSPRPLPKRKREPHPLRASPKNLLATPVSTAVTLTHSHPHPRHLRIVSTRGRRARSTPRRTSARTRTVPIAAGRLGQSPGQWPPNGGPVAATAVHRLSRLFSRDLGTIFHGKHALSSSSCVSSPVWRKAGHPRHARVLR